ncbi:MAG: crotonase/enoyl-CoA hydratase family protein [Pseudomonadota bacterium]
MPIKLETEDGIATVTLSRPEKKNAMSLELLEALVSTCAALEAQPGLRAVILTGAGGVFSAGIDLAVMGQMAADPAKLSQMLATRDAEGANAFQAPMLCWTRLPVPVIAAVEGLCFGAGLQLALGADIRIVHPDTRLSIMEAKWGLVPDMGITATLPRLLRADAAKVLMMTGRVMSGREAERHGLVTELSEAPRARAEALAAEIAARSPDAVAASKRLVEEAWTGGPEALALEAQLQGALIGTPNQMEAVAANIQKRPPRFG